MCVFPLCEASHKGKSFLACAFGKEACRQGYRTRYIRMPDLLQMHAEVSTTVTGVSKLIRKFESYTLLILDEWLIDDLSLQQEHFLFELIERRYTDKSTSFVLNIVLKIGIPD